MLLAGLTMLLLCADNPVSRHAAANLTATIFEPGGKKFATGVSIHIFKDGSVGEKPVAACTTDGKGVFSIDMLAAGKYALWAEKDSLVLYQYPVIISPEYTSLRNDTLESPASLTGVVKIECGHDPSTVSIELLGTGKSVVAGATGTFKMMGLAGGTYECVATSSLDGYSPLTTTATVTSQHNDVYPDTLRLLYKNIPFVEGVRIAEDTLRSIVRISWNKNRYSNLQDYAVYRNSCTDVNSSVPPIVFTTDTFFLDTVNPVDTSRVVSGGQINSMGKSDTALQCFRYRIAIRNKNQEIGPALGYDQYFAPSGRITTYFGHLVQVLNRWCGNYLCRNASIHDTVEIYSIAKNITRPLSRLLIYDPVKHDTIAATVAGDSLGQTLECIGWCTFDSVGLYFIQAAAIDISGKTTIDTIQVSIIEDKPVVFGCNDMGVFCGTAVSLHDSVIDRYGSIVRYEWKIGAKEWTVTSGPEITFTAPETEQELLCQFAAVDDDGFRSIDTIRVFTSYKVQRIAAEGYHTIFTKTDGNQWACGHNEYGQFGENIPDGFIYSPVMISKETQRIAEGSGFVMILKSNGSLWGCGKNDWGQLGIGPTAWQYPFPLQLRSDVRNMAAGGFHSMVIDNSGTLWACGGNDAGQLGDGTMQIRYVPVKIMTGVKAIATGEQHSLILTNDGTLWACGKNNFGQLGDSSMLDQPTPVQIMTGVEAIATGSNHSLILKSDGTLWACGQNNFGQLGVDITENWSLPVLVTTDVKNIAAGQYHSLILKTDKSLWTCGNNSVGQLGNGTKINSHVPIEIMTDVSGIAAGALHSLILKTDGTMWGCGENRQGQLGYTKTITFIKPTRIIPFQYNR